MDNQFRDDYDRRDRSSGWMPLLLALIAFIAGWGAKGFMDQQNTSIFNSPTPQVGIGGGPETSIQPKSSASPFTFSSPEASASPSGMDAR